MGIYFTDGETEAQRSKEICPSPHHLVVEFQVIKSST